jgi:hypothetical protein
MYVRLGQYVSIKYHHSYVRSDPSYAKVIFNTIMYYVLLCDVNARMQTVPSTEGNTEISSTFMLST